MSKYIKREDAIEKIEYLMSDYVPFLDRATMGIPLETRMAIENIPSADVVEREKYEDLKECYDMSHHYEMEYKEQLERKRGEWIRQEEYYYGESVVTCSACDEDFICTDLDVIKDLAWNFCPNCGADMRGSDNERL